MRLSGIMDVVEENLNGESTWASAVDAEWTYEWRCHIFDPPPQA